MTNKKAASLARALDAAVELIADQGLERLSIAGIAAASHCSTATIYDVYSSKENMLADVIGRCHEVCEAPSIDQTSDPADALSCMLSFLQKRIRFLSSARTAQMFKASVSRSASDGDRLERLFEERDPLPDLTTVIERAIQVGHFRDLDPAKCAYCIIAAVSYEPLQAGLFFSGAVDAAALIDTAVRIYLTPVGIQRLMAWEEADATRSGLSSIQNHAIIGKHVFHAHRPMARIDGAKVA